MTAKKKTINPLPDRSESLLSTEAIDGRSLWDDARRRLFANKAAVTSIVTLSIITLMAIAAPLLSPHSYEATNTDYINQPPSLNPFYLLGTDSVGRDLWVRTLYGARISLAVGFIATIVALTIGVLWGATAGFIGGKVDQVMMRIVDILYSLPFMFFVIILVVVFGNKIFLIFLALGAVEWLTMARIVRGQALTIKGREFIEAAEAAGVSRSKMIFRHIIPNVLGPVLVYVTLTIPAVILQESFLSFLGLGVQEPLTSWGRLVADGKDVMQNYPWQLLFPAVMMAVTLFCFNFIGDGLRDALDPKDR